MDLRVGDVIPGPQGRDLKLIGSLGAGGFGQVFLAEDPDGHKVAVKTVRTVSLSDESLRVFQNELKACVLVKHQNVVDVHHVDDGNNSTGIPPFIVLEFMAGGSLEDIFARARTTGSQLPIEEALAFCSQIANGMKALNAYLVHRDLKPANVLLTDGAAPTVKIADFGLAKLTEAATRTGTFKGWGTPPYMAPESFEDAPSTLAVDIYAAGVLFYEISTLQRPIAQPPNGDWRAAHLFSTPPDPRSVRPDLPPAFSQLVLSMLHKDAQKRPTDWDEVLKRLTALDAPTRRADVSALVDLATERMRRSLEQENAAAAALAAADERRKLLENAFQEVVGTAVELVDAFNADSAVGKITTKRADPTWVEFFAPSVGQLLVLHAKPIEDQNVQGLGIVRCVVSIEVQPHPRPLSRQQIYNDSTSMSGFNAVYVVSRDTDRFGSWVALRFEHHPFSRQRAWPRWFALELEALPRQLGLLRAIGAYQHEQQHFDQAWLLELFKHLV
jgi:hypothetical protein